MAGPLAGVVVVDLTRALSGPHAAMMLGDLGARVIKVEPPTGDDTRGWGPPWVGPPEAPISTYYLSANRNKESVVVDLRTDEGLRLVRRLVRRADVLLENFRPGVLERRGLDHATLHEINPGLVILSITGFGHDGPEAMRAGYDQIAQAEGGLMNVTGPPGHPTKLGVPISDLLAGMYGAYGVVAALFERERTGRGRIVRTSLLAATVGVHAFQGTRWTVAREIPTTQGDHHPSIAPYGLFHAADGPMQISVASQLQWRSFAPLVGLAADDPRFVTNRQRVNHIAELVASIEAVLATHTRQHWLAVLDAAGVPSGQVRRIDEVYGWEQTRSQGLLIEVDHPVLGRIELPGPPLRLDDNAYAGGAEVHLAPPGLGEHTASVQAWLDELDDLDAAIEPPGRADATGGAAPAAGRP
jgi:crotonobetainyl-CoA:carnitine CoA-transferase CaiB-like acyl-CoA transferase